MKRVSGLLFLPLVVGAYALLYWLYPEKTTAALLIAWHLFLKIIPILLVVILLMGIFNYFFDAGKISRLLGEASGIRGWIYATFGGILSHGPSYLWYPMLADLRKHGAREGLIVTFFYTRAIKIPWLPVMISYFGWRFTILFSLYLILAGILQGILYDRLLSKR